jgi:hypothetical protein
VGCSSRLFVLSLVSKLIPASCLFTPLLCCAGAKGGAKKAPKATKATKAPKANARTAPKAAKGSVVSKLATAPATKASPQKKAITKAARPDFAGQKKQMQALKNGGKTTGTCSLLLCTHTPVPTHSLLAPVLCCALTDNDSQTGL